MPRRTGYFARVASAWFTVFYLWITWYTPLSLNRAVAVPVGRLLARLVPRVRRVAMDNLERAYGDSLTRLQKEQVYQGVLTNLSIVAAEFSQTGPIARRKDMVSVVGAENLHKGQGYLCIGAHMGNWELMAPFMATACGYKVAEVVRPFDHPAVDRIIDRTRTLGNIVTIPKDRAGGEIIRYLKEGYLVGILVDQSPRDNGVPVSFFGAPCWATVAPVMIALRARVPVVPVALTRKPDRRYVLRFYPPIEMARTGDFRGDLVRNTQLCQDAIERMIRDTPDQWLWLHRRWKERPRLAEEWEHRIARDR